MRKAIRILGKPTWKFRAGAANVASQGEEGLKRYWSRAEKPAGNTLQLPGQGKRGFARPRGAEPIKDVMDAKYNTVLTPKEQAGYKPWLATLDPNIGHTKDYDMQGYYKNKIYGQTTGTGQDARGHFDDEFKKPNHPTYSTSSRLNQQTGGAGEWVRTGSAQRPRSWAQAKKLLRSVEKLERYLEKSNKDNGRT
ncbi:hypothetical protein EBS67_00465 [bacterium]|nr:hypothetical protein [bacterium]NBT60222.1 hypothetical protein [Planctomycetia bacterium]